MPAVLHRLTGPSPLPDAELVRRFRDGRDEGAFAALVRRHGPMVFGVCRRMLPAHHDAEDAFQATFLVLAAKPDAVPPGRAGAWLHGVAGRVCLKARRTAARRLAAERIAVERPVPASTPPPDGLAAVIDEVLLGLPEKYRLPVVECHLAGRSRREAAARLGWTEGTLSGRLARALDLLADRLTRRGVGLSAAALAGVLSARPLRAMVPAKLTASTVTVAGLLADGLPVPAGLADTLSRGVMNAMWWTKWKAAGLAGLAAGLLIAGAGLAGMGRAADPPVKPESPAADTAPASKPARGWVTTQTLKRDHPITVLAAGPDGVVAGSDESGTLWLWDPKAGKDPKVLLKGGEGDGHITAVDRLGFKPGGTDLFMILDGGRTVFWKDVSKDGPSSGAGYGSPDDPARNLGFSADGSTWVEKSNKASSFVLRASPFTDPESAVKFENVELDADITHLAASTDGELVAVVTAGPAVRLVERAGHRTRWVVDAPKLAATAVRFSPDGNLVAVVGENGFAALYDVTTGKVAAVLKGLDGIVSAVAFSPDGKRVATGGQDHTSRVWDAATGKQLAVLKGHTDSVKDVAFGPDGKTLVTGSADKTVRVWELKE
ncbi:MAG: sigma-70 family RNA polymerase sigma factor [Gemmataceae bacterium]|nr:sigma-70 family RNA polymerase sigma factor [Gemmataceae bacterium]